jgi:AcrR family transcriptional regulator
VLKKKVCNSVNMKVDKNGTRPQKAGKGSKTRTPRQQRGFLTKKRIMKAAERLFARKGFHEINSNMIAAEAGVSIGSFYAYFEDKKALFVELLIQHQEEFAAQVLREVSMDFLKQGGRRERIFRIMKKILNDRTFSPQFLRQVIAMRYSDPEIGRFYDMYENRSLRNLVSLFHAFRNNIRVRDAEAAAMVVHGLSKELILNLKVFDYPIERDRLLREYVEMIYKYLFVDVPPPQKEKDA